MADAKSISRATKCRVAKLPKGMNAQDLKTLAGDPDEMVEVPYMRQSYLKAPEIDPYLKPETVTQKVVRFGEAELPPIRRGIESGLDLNGNPVDRNVSVIWISRRQIDSVLDEIKRERPELEVVLSVVSEWMCHLDTQRSEMGFGVSCAKSWLKGDAPGIQKALECLDTVTGMVGRWDDERRLYLHC